MCVLSAGGTILTLTSYAVFPCQACDHYIPVGLVDGSCIAPAPARQGAVFNLVIAWWSQQAALGLFGFGPAYVDVVPVLIVYGDVRRPPSVRPAEVGHSDGVGAVVALGSVN